MKNMRNPTAMKFTRRKPTGAGLPESRFQRPANAQEKEPTATTTIIQTSIHPRFEDGANGLIQSTCKEVLMDTPLDNVMRLLNGYPQLRYRSQLS